MRWDRTRHRFTISTKNKASAVAHRIFCINNHMTSGSDNHHIKNRSLGHSCICKRIKCHYYKHKSKLFYLCILTILTHILRPPHCNVFHTLNILTQKKISQSYTQG
ncbi:hypothetical protein AC17_4755 [Escherichia coli 2-210-07_S3_C2]|nr:hypothetical protein AC17_4755 [Escherichia coli 2-210-07_S3_C2]